jgi:hypothetical protein
MSNGHSDLKADRPYWEAYINQVAVATGKEKPYPDTHSVKRASYMHLNILPSATDGVSAQTTANLMKFIIDTVNGYGRSERTSEQLLNIVSPQSVLNFPRQGMPTPPQQIASTPPQQIRRSSQEPSKAILEQRKYVSSQEKAEVFLQEKRKAEFQQQKMKGPLPNRG